MVIGEAPPEQNLPGQKKHKSLRFSLVVTPQTINTKQVFTAYP